jgi:hypothetical protein
MRRLRSVLTLAPLRRHASDFSYIRLGAPYPYRHVLEYEDPEEGEAWVSSTIPRVYPDPEVVAAADLEGESARYARAMELRERHPGVWLVHLFVERLEGSAGGAPLPLAKGVLEALLAPCTPAERAALATPAGRAAALAAAQASIHATAHAVGRLEEDALDSGVVAPAPPSPHLPTPASRAAALHAMAAADGTLAATLATLRALCLAHTARLEALGGGEPRWVAERQWLGALGLTPPSPTSFRSPRIPPALWAVWDDPLGSPLSPGEVRDEGSLRGGDVVRASLVEHRDRVEFLSRARLPPPLHAGAPTPVLEAAARVLDANPSLTPEDKVRMLAAYAGGLEEEEAAWDTSLEAASILAPQPQWGWYDPEVTGLQDAAVEAMTGRGAFSRYRGSGWREGLNPPERSGLPPSPATAAGTPGTPLETMEEVAATVKEVERRGLADAAAATAAITAALEAQMGLRPRRQGAVQAQGQPGQPPAQNFFQRYAAGQRPAPHLPGPPPSGHRVEVPRQELEMGAGVKQKGKDKGKGKK